MANLPKFTLEFNDKKDKWVLENSAGRTVKSFDKKEEATKGGMLK